MNRPSRYVWVLLGSTVPILMLIGAFGISRMHLDWLIHGWGWGISNEFEILTGAVLFAGALVSASVLVGATMVARALSSVVGRSGTPGDSGTERSDDDEGDAAV